MNGKLWISVAATVYASFVASGREPAPMTRLASRLSKGENQILVTYGTSLTAAARWQGELKRRLEAEFKGDLTVVNLGISGTHSGRGYIKGNTNAPCGTNPERMARIVAAAPDTILIEFSINDAYTIYNVSLTESRQNMETLLGYIRQHLPDAEVIIHTVSYPVAGGPAKVRPDIDLYDQLYQAIARENGLLFIDTGRQIKKFCEEHPSKVTDYLPDYLHPSRLAGTEMIAPYLHKAFLYGTNDTLVTFDAQSGTVPSPASK